MSKIEVRDARLRRLALLFASVAALSACGGGGGGTEPNAGPTPPPPPAPSPATSATYAQQCAPTNPYRLDARQATTVASLTTEKTWMSLYLGEAYLWPDELQVVSPSVGYNDTTDVYGALDGYFNAQLSTAVTASGRPRDRFSFTYPTKAWNDFSQSGTSLGYGLQWKVTSPYPPRGIRVAYVEPDSPAARSGLQRGDTLVSFDGISADINTSSGVDLLNEALSPSSALPHRLVFTSVGGATRDVTLTPTSVTSTPVPLTAIHQTTGGHKVGYILFNDHIASAEAQLINAVTQLRDAGVQDLVLDLRYNGGGYLYLASELAYMIAGPTRTNGQVFEQMRFSSRRPADNASPDSRTPFFYTSCILDSNYNCTQERALPTLNLSRVYVLTSNGTCSASESIVNGLRGVDVQVNLIGGTTCGKPYGFTAKDNCGVSYFPIEFQGVNAKGFGDYADGLAATCAASDDLGQALGVSTEGQLAAALYHVDNSRCQAQGNGRAQPSAAAGAATRLLRGPHRENRFLTGAGRVR